MTLHVIGAGLAGLACALAAADSGLEVVVHEAARQAGGRCRSWDDSVIGARIDNGTHVVVGGNKATRSYLLRIDAAETLRALPAVPRAYDLAIGAVWQPSSAVLLRAYASSLWRLAFDDRGTVAERLGGSADYRHIWEPLAVATLNTASEQASAALFRSVLARTVWKGTGASRMHVARDDLSSTFVAPALAALAGKGVELRLGIPLRAPIRRASRVVELAFDGSSIVLSRHDAVVLAVPWWTATKWLDLPELPDSPIVNIHYRLTKPPANLADHTALGIVGGHAQWVFRRGQILAVTISAAAELDDRDSDEIAATVWTEIAGALDLSGQAEACRVIKEKRATLLHTAETESLRPHRRQGENLFLAGDWTATGLPCTIEGAIQSGHAAAADAVALLRDGT